MIRAEMALLALALLLAAALNSHSEPQTLDRCGTDTECEIAAERRCALGETEYCVEVAR